MRYLLFTSCLALTAIAVRVTHNDGLPLNLSSLEAEGATDTPAKPTAPATPTKPTAVTGAKAEEGKSAPASNLPANPTAKAINQFKQYTIDHDYDLNQKAYNVKLKAYRQLLSTNTCGSINQVMDFLKNVMSLGKAESKT